MGCIYIGIKNNDLYVVIQGKGTAEYCSELDTCIQKQLSSSDINHVYFDTKEALYLDSSFIGVILSVKKKLASKENSVCLLNPSDKVVDIFQIMGLNSFVPSIYDETMSCEECPLEIHKKLENSISDIKLLLESHKTLMSTSCENHKRFALVEKVFQKELEQKQSHN